MTRVLSKTVSLNKTILSVRQYEATNTLINIFRMFIFPIKKSEIVLIVTIVDDIKHTSWQL